MHKIDYEMNAGEVTDVLNFFRNLKCIFGNFISLFDIAILENIFVSIIFFILLICLLMEPSFMVGLALFFFFLWAMIF